MTIITIDDELINGIIAVSHYENPQEAVIKILSNYLQQQKKELPLFERLRFIDDESAEDNIASLFERDRDTGYTIITRRDTDDAVVMSLEFFNSLMETVHLLKFPANAAHLERSIAQFKQG